MGKRVAAACIDRERRTCIMVNRTDSVVEYIPLDIEDGLEVLSMSTAEFDDRFRPMLEYPVEKAVDLYVSYARTIGGSEDAMKYLSGISTVSEEDVKMATAKKTTRTEKAAAAKPKPAQKGKPAPEKVKCKPAKEPAKKNGGSKPNKEKAPRDTASQMFQDLIMEGKLTDDKIFEKVKERFNLDDSKKGYVKWYRNNMKKKGMNPPGPK